MSRNPNWTRDELILAMDIYLQNGRTQLGKSHPEVRDLSQLLNELPIHPRSFREAKFRNEAGVSMKLGNFLSIDPSYDGSGLNRGSKLEQEIWNEFSSDPDRLHKIASTIRANYQDIDADALQHYGKKQDEEEFKEGKILTRVHKQRERSSRAVRRKKQKMIEKTGSLACEVCSFDFEKQYGTLGQGFAECHHTTPLSELDSSRNTKLSDLAIVCSNCHRMLHRSDPMMSINELRGVLKCSNHKGG